MPSPAKRAAVGRRPFNAKPLVPLEPSPPRRRQWLLILAVALEVLWLAGLVVLAGWC